MESGQTKPKYGALGSNLHFSCFKKLKTNQLGTVSKMSKLLSKSSKALTGIKFIFAVATR
jgi:hypothetical protein